MIEKHIDLSLLPRTSKGIDWNNSIGYKCKYTYGEHGGVITIVSMNDKRKIKIATDDGREMETNADCIRLCKIGELFSQTFEDKRPELVKYLMNESDKYKSYTCNSKVKVKCEKCGYEHEVRMSNLYYRGYKCNMCSSGKSFPERLMYEILKCTKYTFEMEKIFDWASDKRYDFYIQEIGCIIETHGVQHYQQSRRGMKLEDIQQNDKIKYELAMENGIQNYITVNCSRSELIYICDSIKNTDFEKVLDINIDDIDIVTCNVNANRGNVVKTCDMYDNNIPIDEMSKELGVCQTSIYYYLNKGKELGLCKYNPTNKKVFLMEK